MKKIAVLIDFTGVSELALEHAALIARQSLSQVTLLHVAAPDQAGNEKEIKESIRNFAKSLDVEGVPFRIQVDFGDFFATISKSIDDLNVDMIIVGTHGIRGIKQNFVGSAILRLIKLIDIPALIVQGHSETPHEGYLKILVPLLGKTQENNIVKHVGNFASAFQSYVHFLSFYNEENQAETEAITKTIVEDFKSYDPNVVVDFEKVSKYTNSFSKSIVEYSDIEEDQVIVLLISQNYEGYFSADDQENLLLNRLGKPVLCI